MAQENTANIDSLNLQTSSSRFRAFLTSKIFGFFTENSTKQEEQLDNYLKDVENEIQSFNEEIGTKANFERYLTTSESMYFKNMSENIAKDLHNLSSTKWSFKVERKDIERFEDLKNTLKDSKKFLKNYNENFVQQEVDKYKSLFDNREFSLNEEQCKAVIRNDTYNQVVAGAGTGKTLALTHRIAYLLEKGVKTERILTLTLTNKACDEIEERLEKDFGFSNVDVRTFHSFGYKLVDEASDSKKGVIEKSQKLDFIEDQINDASPTSNLGTHYRNFISLYNTEIPSKTDFKSEKEYIEARSELDYQTIKGDKVKSQGEKAVADFLFTHNIEYRYEAIADWAETAEDRGNYEPDFYLPEHDIYIEHWGLNKNGEVAPWFSITAEEYKEDMKWKRREFEKSKYTLLETYDHQYRDQRLEDVLRRQLENQGVELTPLTTGKIVKKVLNSKKGEEKIFKEFRDFIENAKMFNISIKELESRIKSESNPKTYYFSVCGYILLSRYQKWLKENDSQDWEDMINHALEIIKANPEEFKTRYDHILVDEFQDVSLNNIKLVNELTGEKTATMFCVGDDWQSIYGFRGAVVEYFTEFEKYFGKQTRTDLTKNYRSQAAIVETGNQLIQNNSSQLEKNVEPVKNKSKKPKIHTIDGKNDWKYLENTVSYAVELVEKYIDSGSRPEDIMILSRYGKSAKYIEMMENRLKKHEIPVEREKSRGVQVMTAHSSKGREAKHVILLNAAEDQSGFSPATRENQLLNIVRDVKINNEEEERRLFYVAITRAEETLDILTRNNRKSKFIKEIKPKAKIIKSLSNPGKIGEKVTLTAQVDQLWQAKHESIAQKGLLKDSTGKIKVTTWKNNYPPRMIENAKYLFKNIKITEDHNGSKQLETTNETEINKL